MAVGYYRNGTKWEPLAERWNGKEWSVSKPPFPAGAGIVSATLRRVSCTSESACNAVGRSESSTGVSSTLEEEWNGTSWSVVASVNRKEAGNRFTDVSCVLVGAPRFCVASGYSTFSAKPPASFVENNGVLEEPPVPSGTTSSALNGVDCQVKTISYVCVAVGRALGASGNRPLVDNLNGAWVSEFAPLPVGSSEGEFTTASCSSYTVCYAIGTYVSGGATKVLADGWEGIKWSIESIPSPSSTQIYPVANSCTTNTCDVVGRYYNGEGKSVGLIIRKELSKWALETAPSPPGASGIFLWDVSCPAEEWCMAVGNYAAGTEAKTLAERFS